MKYISRNGRLFYYDRVLYKWQLAEATMLFLLGFEAITAYSLSVSDSLIIPNSAYIKDLNEYVDLTDFEIYDDIHDYLSEMSKVDDYRYYFTSSVNGLKLTINDMTGTDSDRTVPIIFKNDVNSIDLSKPPLRMPTKNNSNPTYYDIQAQKIIDIFADADFSGSGTDDLSVERQSNSQLYKLLDYKSMYSYALGVLYGCRCLGFNSNLVWRIDPIFWYNNENINLVRSAWHTFKFHYSESDDSVKHYRDIAYNRLWNFGYTKFGELVDSSIVNGEVQSVKLSIKLSEINGINVPTEVLTELVLYDSHLNKYFDVMQEDSSWKSIDNLRDDEGIVPLVSAQKTYYIGSDKLVVFKSFDSSGSKSSSDSARDLNYFISSGNVGWVNSIDSLPTEPYSSYTLLNATEISTGKLVRCIKQDINSFASIYGIDFDINTNTSKLLVNQTVFYSNYEILI